MNDLEVLPPAWFASLDETLQQKVERLQPWLKGKLFCLGDDGFNNHVLGVARSLKTHLNKQELTEVLSACGGAYQRHIPQLEIDKAVATAFDDSPKKGAKKWPSYSKSLVRKITAKSSIKNAGDLTQKFQIEAEGSEAILKQLFPNDPLICMGKDRHDFSTVKLSEHLSGKLSEQQFIVPSPMCKAIGLTKDGKPSAHCLDNTGKRVHLVIDFDTGTKNEHAACIDHLAEFAPLVMVVDSGNKSLHAWFACRDTSEGDLKRFMAYSVQLGGDHALFSRYQFARTPNATRDNGNKQSVVVFSPMNADVSPWRIEALPSIEELPKKSEFKLTHYSEIEFSTEANDFVERLLTKGGTSVILAAPGAGKSFFALDLASCVATGRPWRDREAEQGGVIYVCLEGVTGFKNRIHAFRERGSFTDNCPFYLLEAPLNLLNDEHGGKLVEMIEQAAAESSMPVSLIIVDTLSRSMAGANENAGEDMTKMIATLQSVQSATGAHVSLVHHTGKDESRGARGHSSLNGAIDTEISLSRDARSKIITATVTKQKDFECEGKFPFKLIPVQLGVDDRGREIVSCVVEHLDESEAPQKQGRPQAHAARVLLDLLPLEGVKEWKEAALEKMNISDSTFKRRKNELGKDNLFQIETETGRIVRNDDSADDLI